MKIALASAKIVDRDMEANLACLAGYMKAAKKEGAELVCFGEAFLQGFNALCWEYEKDRNMAVSTSSPVFERIQKLSAEIGVDVLFGYNERQENVIYSSCALNADGRILHNYRRISKGWKEYRITDEHYREGTTVEVFRYPGKKCAIGLCGDLWEYPQRFDLGEDLLFWPVYVCWTREEWENGGREEYAQQANLACRNTLYINSLCDGDAYGGAAHFLDGRTEKELPIFHEGLLYVTV